MSTLAAIALGSNLEFNPTLASGSTAAQRSSSDPVREADDGRRANLLLAVEQLRTLGRVVAVSTFHDTAPVGYLDQPRFLNGALLLETELPPLELLRGLLAIERSMGRDRTGVVSKGPRLIDLDLLLYGEAVMSTGELMLPHPALQDRLFVLEPLVEVAPGMVHPVLRLTVEQMVRNARALG